MKHYNRVLTIAGSDSGGGAGIQADIKTIQSLGCYAASAITAVTVQNTMGVASVFPIPADVVAAQIDAVLDDIGADAIKIGMLLSQDTVRSVASCLKRHRAASVVLDPVMVSTSGKRLLQEEAIDVMKTEMFPLARVITPNIPEAELLADCGTLTSPEDMVKAAKMLSQQYGVSVLLKAGHAIGKRLVDYFYDAESDELLPLPSMRVNTQNTHGTGCTMSSAFASHLALGKSLQDAAQGAKAYISQAILAGADYEIGKGHGPVKHWI